MRADVCVVGAGVSGLAVAAALVASGLSVVVAEAGAAVGGRARHRVVDGYTVGDGSHLLHTAWQALRVCAEPAPPALQGFAPGVRVFFGGRHWRFGAAPSRPQLTFASLRTPLGNAADKARLSKLLYRLAAAAPERALGGPEQACADTFVTRGYSEGLVDQFLRPYLTAFAADEELTTSIRGADWLLRMLVRGRFAVAAGGVGSITRQLAERIPGDSLLLNTRVHSVNADRVATDAGEIRAAAVVVAADPQGAVSLFPGLHEPLMRSATTFWHSAEDAELGERHGNPADSVLLDAEPGSPVARTAAVSRADPGAAPPGRALIATTVLGGDGKQLEALDRTVRTRLAELYRTGTRGWHTIEARHVEHALVTMPSPHNFARPVRLINGLYVCGDHRDLPNLEGALRSAQRTATAVLDDLKKPA